MLERESGGGLRDPAEILKTLDYALRLSPGNDLVRYEQVIWKSIIGDWLSVIEDCDLLVEKRPEWEGQVLTLRAAASLRLGEVSRARAEIDRAIELGAKGIQAWVTRAQCHLTLGELDAVPGDLAEALEQQPDDILANCLLADYYDLKGEYALAIETLEKICLRNPSNAYLKHRFARSLLIAERVDDALVLADQAISLEPEHPEYRFGKSWILAQLNRFDEALTEINLACHQAPDNPSLFYSRARVLLGLNKREEAIEDLSRAIELAPDFGAAISLRAKLRTESLDYQLANEDYNLLVELFPDSFDSYSLRARFHTRMGRDDLAQQDINAAIQMDPGSAEGLWVSQELARAEALFDAEKFGAAIEVLTEIIEKDENCFPAILKCASCYWYDAQFVEAVDAYGMLLEQIDHNAGPDALRMLVLGARGQVYAELGEYELAINDLNQVAEADSKFAGPVLKA